MSTGQRHSSYNDETERIPLDAFLADVDAYKALRAELSYGTLYVRRPNQTGAFDTLLVGSGGGYCDRRSMSKLRVRQTIATGVEQGGSVTTGQDVWPSKWDGGGR